MKIAYLLNTYPLPSSTFIRREIEALERLGLTIYRFAMRRWTETLVEERDQAEARKTTYLLDRKIELILHLSLELLGNTAGVLRALWLTRDFTARGYVRGIAYFLEAVRFKREAERRSIQHFHAHFSSNAATVAVLAQELGGPTFSFTVHGPEDFHDAEPNRLLLKIHKAAFVVVISDYAWGQLATRTGPRCWHKIHVVRCGLDLEEFQPSDVPNSQEIVCIGRLTPRKGQVLLPLAVAKALAGGHELHMTLIGDGPIWPEIVDEIDRLELKGHVHLAGWGSDAEVRQAIAASRALVLPTFSEGLPVVVLEALALGRPVIATYVAAIPEILDATCGWPVPAGDVEELAAAMVRALRADTSELSAMGRIGRQRVAERHDIRGSAAQLRNLFRQYASSDDKFASKVRPEQLPSAAPHSLR